MISIFEQLKDDLSTLDRKAIFSLVYTAFGLSSIYYLKNPEVLVSVTRGTAAEALGNYVAYSPEGNLPALAYWVAIVTLFYFVLPAAAIKFVYKERLTDFGLKSGIEYGFW